MDEIQKQTVPAKRLDAVAQSVAVLLVFLLPILFFPSSWMPFAYSKVLLIAIASLLPLALWSIARFREGSFMFANSYVLWLAFLLPVAYLISALLSGSIANSVVGIGYENNTLIFILLLTALLGGVSVMFTSIASVVKMLLAVGSSFAVLAFLQIVRLVFGAENILPSLFSANPTTALIGSWNDLAVFSGLIVLISLTALMYAPKTLFIRVLTYTNLAMALFLLVAVNLKVVWVMLALLSLVLFVYFIATKKTNEVCIEENEKEGVVKMIAPAAIFAVSVLFVFAGTTIGPKVSELLSIQHVDVRPSWEGTIEVVKNTYSDDAVFGTGPNTFASAWTKHKPSGVNDTAFWNIDFRSGIGLIPTAFVTVGIVGGILWILFGASVIYAAFRTLWARMPNNMTRFTVFATVSGSIYLLILLVVYVPQTVMLALTFLMIGLFLAVARNINAIKTRKISATDSQAASFVLMLTLTVVTLMIVSVTVVMSQRVLAASLLGRSASAAESQDFQRAKLLAERAHAFTSGGFFGSDDRASSILAQLGIIDLRDVVSGDTEEEGYRERLQNAIEGVILHARAALEENPTNYANHVFLGNVYEQLSPLGIDGAYNAALASYAAAREINPTNPSIPLSMARAAFGADKLEDAQKFAQEALALKRNYTDAYFLLSQVAIKSGNTGQAIATTESAAILAPNNTGLLFQLGVLQYSTGDYTRAESVFARAVTLNPDYANALYYLGLSSLQLGKEEQALAAFKRVSELNPDNEQVKQIIASIEAGELSLPSAPVDKATTPVSEIQ